MECVRPSQRLPVPAAAELRALGDRLAGLRESPQRDQRTGTKRGRPGAGIRNHDPCPQVGIIRGQLQDMVQRGKRLLVTAGQVQRVHGGHGDGHLGAGILDLLAEAGRLGDQLEVLRDVARTGADGDPQRAVEQGERREVAGPLGDRLALREHLSLFGDVGAEAPSHRQDHQSRPGAQPIGLGALRQLRIQLAHALPVAAGGGGVLEAQPSSCARVPARRIHRLSRLLVVLRDERRLLIDPLARHLLDRLRDPAMGRGPPLGEL